MRVGAIDCGTNSIRLLVADTDTGSTALHDITRLMKVVRLGQGVDRSGRLHPDALARTFRAMEEYRKECDRLGVEKLRVVATSATRDARNAEEFIEGTREILGVAPEVIAGTEEARLSFSGAALWRGDDIDLPALVVDIGGGSTEFIVGVDQAEKAISTNMGAVRVQERFFADVLDKDGVIEPRTPQLRRAIIEATRFIDNEVARAHREVDFTRVRTLIGVAGTVTTVTAHALGLEKYEPEKIDGARLSVEKVMHSCNWMMTSSLSQRAALGFMPQGREDVIGAGSLVWQRIIEGVAKGFRDAGRELRTIDTSEHDILDGIAISIAQ